MAIEDDYYQRLSEEQLESHMIMDPTAALVFRRNLETAFSREDGQSHHARLMEKFRQPESDHNFSHHGVRKFDME